MHEPPVKQSATPTLLPSSPPQVILGIESSGSVSSATLTTAEGTILNTAYGTSLHPLILGFDASATALSELIRRTLRVDLPAPIIIVAGIAGAFSGSLRNRYIAQIKRTPGVPPKARVLVSNEALGPFGLVLSAARGHDIEPRIVVAVAGIEAIAVACSVKGAVGFHASGNPLLVGDKYVFKVDKCSGGWGSVFGTDGCTYAVAMQALNLAFRITDGRVPVVMKKVLIPGVVTFYEEQEAKALAITVMYAALAHFSIRADDFDDGVTALAAHLNDKETTRIEIAAFTPILSSLAASGHGLCKQVFVEAGHEIGVMLCNVLNCRKEADKSIYTKTAVCVVGEMFNAWREVPDFADSFRAAMVPFTTKGGSIYIPKGSLSNSAMLTETGHDLSYGCAHAAGVACAVSTEEWTSKAFGHLHKI